MRQCFNVLILFHLVLVSLWELLFSYFCALVFVVCVVATKLVEFVRLKRQIIILHGSQYFNNRAYIATSVCKVSLKLLFFNWYLRPQLICGVIRSAADCSGWLARLLCINNSNLNLPVFATISITSHCVTRRM